MQIPHYNFNKYGLYKKSISYLDIEDWFQAQEYNLQYGGDISDAPTGKLEMELKTIRMLFTDLD